MNIRRISVLSPFFLGKRDSNKDRFVDIFPEAFSEV